MKDSLKDPVTAAAIVYDEEPCARSFEEDLYLHLKHPDGIVFKDPAGFALVRPVRRNADYYELTDPQVIFRDPDAWWIYLLAGDFHYLLSLLPQTYPFIGWERKNKARFYHLSTLINRCKKSIMNSSKPCFYQTDASRAFTKDLGRNLPLHLRGLRKEE